VITSTVDRLEPSVIVPQVAQGALAIECRSDDVDTIATLVAVEDAAARRVVDAERAFLSELGGDCELPAGANAYRTADGDLAMVGVLSSLDGRRLLREARVGDDPERLGRSIARYLLDDLGGRSLLENTP